MGTWALTGYSEALKPCRRSMNHACDGAVLAKET